MRDSVEILIAVIIVIIVCIGGWKAQRWFNWKVSYGGKVDQRIEQLEARVDTLEQQLQGE